MPAAVSAPVWLATLAGLAGIVVLDLLVIARRQREVTIRDATLWVLFYVALAAAFAAALFLWGDSISGRAFVAGYITEYSLSVDNLFVFLIIMARFGVPPLAQDKVLYIGIVVSLVLRGACIAAGAAVVAAFSWVFYVFGAFLVYTAVKLALERESGEAEEFQENVVVRGVRRVLPSTPSYVGSRFTVQRDGQRLFTPMIVVVTAIGLANVIFALDSIPAIFGLTQDPYVVFTANAFALMGLRQLFFLIGGLLTRVVYLNVGLSAILAFIGVKLIDEALHGSGIDAIGSVRLPEVTITESLGFIVGTLAVTIAVSLLKTRGQAGPPEASA